MKRSRNRDDARDGAAVKRARADERLRDVPHICTIKLAKQHFKTVFSVKQYVQMLDRADLQDESYTAADSLWRHLDESSRQELGHYVLGFRWKLEYQSLWQVRRDRANESLQTKDGSSRRHTMTADSMADVLKISRSRIAAQKEGNKNVLIQPRRQRNGKPAYQCEVLDGALSECVSERTLERSEWAALWKVIGTAGMIYLLCSGSILVPAHAFAMAGEEDRLDGLLGSRPSGFQTDCKGKNYCHPALVQVTGACPMQRQEPAQEVPAAKSNAKQSGKHSQQLQYPVLPVRSELLVPKRRVMTALDFSKHISIRAKLGRLGAQPIFLARILMVRRRTGDNESLLVDSKRAARRLASLIFTKTPHRLAQLGVKAGNYAQTKSESAARHQPELSPRFATAVDFLKIVLHRMHEKNVRSVWTATCALDEAATGAISLRCAHKHAPHSTLHVLDELDGEQWTTARQTMACPELCLSNLVALETRPEQVSQFVMALVGNILPRQCIGGPRNWSILWNAIALYVRLGPQEDLDLETVVKRIHLTEVPWLGTKLDQALWREQSGQVRRSTRVPNVHDLRWRERQMAFFLRWLFFDIVSKVIRFFFYITESEKSRDGLVYYRKDVWCAIEEHVSQILLRDSCRRVSSIDEYLCAFRRDHSHGIRANPLNVSPYRSAALRLVPKASGVRVLQTLLDTSTMTKVSQRTLSKPANRTLKLSYAKATEFLRDILAILNHERCRLQESDPLVRLVATPDEIHDGFLCLKTKWHACRRPALYMAVWDVSKAFDTIEKDVLLSEVLPSILTQSSYLMCRYQLPQKYGKSGTYPTEYRHVVRDAAGLAHFGRLVEHDLAKKRSNTILSCTKEPYIVHRDAIMKHIHDWLSPRYIVVRGQVWEQRSGIPQGHMLSPLLSSLYLAHMERRTFALGTSIAAQLSVASYTPSSLGESEKGDILVHAMRFQDDYLIVSSDRATLESHALDPLVRGARAYGQYLNPAKLKRNYMAERMHSDTPPRPEELRHVTWCGFRVDSWRVEVGMDTSRTSWPQLLRAENMGACATRSAKLRLLERRALVGWRDRFYEFMFDTRLNSLVAVANNMHVFSYMRALKLMALIVRNPWLKRDGVAALRQVLDSAKRATLCELERRVLRSSRALRKQVQFEFPTAYSAHLIAYAYRLAVSILAPELLSLL
ncbi:Telomerase reverse transcriptase [Porphyridium purpureum]|uniref:Telomerase reverse transcriptase n=1 Tax=Porphyridium purpureum TaxID=35688 RepID=A0A5J4YN28_PORPP|nr:Telomerase reverse transcriptase [Porphyridium purpureum]|eukprot:POR3775..scf295_9